MVSRLAVIPGVGYPNPSRSHFRSQAIWHSARLDSEEHNGHGWLGRSCDLRRQPDPTVADAIFVGDGTIPSAIIGRRTNSIALNNENELQLAAGLSVPSDPQQSDDIAAFVIDRDLLQRCAVTCTTFVLIRLSKYHILLSLYLLYDFPIFCV